MIIFFQAALTGVALMHLRGEPTSVRIGLALARSKRLENFGYALIASTAGMLLYMIRVRLAWTVATFLVVPVLFSTEVGRLMPSRKGSSCPSAAGAKT